MHYIGTSGFSYPYWKNRFYPEKLAASKWLSYYGTKFNTLELNSSFYRFPIVKNLKKSADATPADFKFTVKAHKIITHTKRLRDSRGKINEFMDIVNEGLGNKLACVLFQLPPSYSYSEERMDDILTHILHQSMNVIEFRHVSWWNENVYKNFADNSLTFCSVSYPGLPDNNITTTDIFYKRMHGVLELFKSAYSNEELSELASNIPKNKNSFVYFNNTQFDAGYENALFLKEILN